MRGSLLAMVRRVRKWNPFAELGTKRLRVGGNMAASLQVNSLVPKVDVHRKYRRVHCWDFNMLLVQNGNGKPHSGQLILKGLVVFTLLFRTGGMPFVWSSLEYVIVTEGVNKFYINVTATAVWESVVRPPDLWRLNARPKDKVTFIRTLILVMAKAASWMRDLHWACRGSAWTKVIVTQPNDRLVVIVHRLVEVVTQHHGWTRIAYVVGSIR